MKDNVILRYADNYRMMARIGTSTIDIWSIITDLERNMSPEVEELIRENAALKKLLERAYERLDELKQPVYTGTGSDYLDCVLGVGGFEQYGPIEIAETLSKIETVYVNYPPDDCSICPRTNGLHMWGINHCRHCDQPWPKEYRSKK